MEVQKSLFGFLFRSPIKLLIYLVARKTKACGVEILEKYPPEFIVTKHAYDRIIERIDCDRDKVKKLVVKSWFSRIPVPEKFKNNRELRGYVPAKNERMEYRIFNGFVFVFATKINHHFKCIQKVLITVYSYIKIVDRTKKGKNFVWKNADKWKEKVLVPMDNN